MIRVERTGIANAGIIQPEIRPDIDRAVAEFDELRELSARFGFDLFGALQSLAESLTPVWCCYVDENGAATAGYAIARYKLAERLDGALAALRARNGNVDVGKTVGHLVDPVETTPKMIEAGGRALCSSVWFEGIGDAGERLAIEVYQAMEIARRIDF